MKNKKIILEIIIIPLFISYLLYTLFNTKINILGSIILGIINFELLIKYIKEVNVYRSKYNIYKILFIIFNVVSLFICFMIIYKSINILYLIISLVITSIYGLIFGIINLIKLSKLDKGFNKYIKNSILNLFIGFILISIILKLI